MLVFNQHRWLPYAFVVFIFGSTFAIDILLQLEFPKFVPYLISGLECCLFFWLINTQPKQKKPPKIDDHAKKYKRIHQQLDKLKDYQRDILENSPIGAFAINNHGFIISWNKALQTTTGIKFKNAIGQPIHKLPDPWHDILSQFYSGSTKQAHKVKVELNHRTHWFNLHKIEYGRLSGKNRPSGIVLLVEDVTGVHTLEMELAYSERFSSIGRLAAGVAHEIGNPVTGIACLAQNLKYENDKKTIEETALNITQQTKRIAKIVQNLINFSQHKPAPEIAIETVILNDIVESAIELVKLTPLGKQVDFINLCNRKVVVEGDQQRLLQVFLNLLENARDASKPKDKITIDACIASKHYEVTIADHGRGIPSNLLSRVFDPFFTTKDPGKGAGLGLPTVYNILKEHNGHIFIESQPNHGTQAIIKLPKPSNTYNQDISGPVINQKMAEAIF